ncbi:MULTISPECIES: hypothetical protein [Pseudomonas]|uniref:hypothetical protein n=1 Tax=Pseudomonas TaxID=286 RepID=UPI002160A5C0|nr:hypothetical protein [Pseudomonas sp. B21-047]UVL03206.1 hypothetical protein LOY26_22705 [Pseudomonas sp. B21-047]
MKKLVPDPPASTLLLLDPPHLSLQDPPGIEECDLLIRALTLTVEQTTTVLIESGPSLMRDAMGMNIRLLCRVINALTDHKSSRATAQGVSR